MAADRELTVWELCKVCARQMVGGPRCFTHNPSPEMREEQEKEAARVSRSVRLSVSSG